MPYDYQGAQQRVANLQNLRQAIAAQQPATHYGAGALNVLAQALAARGEKKGREEATQARQAAYGGLAGLMAGQDAEYQTPVEGPTLTGETEMAMSKEAVPGMGLAQALMQQGGEYNYPQMQELGLQQMMAQQAGQADFANKLALEEAKNQPGMFGGTGMTQQAYNTILNSVDESVRPYLKEELARQHTGRERTIQTERGPMTVPGIDVQNAIQKAEAASRGEAIADVATGDRGEIQRARAPVSYMNSIQNDASNLRRVKGVMEMLKDPDKAASLGLQNKIPGADIFYQLNQPEATRIRGLVAGLQNMTIKDLSGAAVTASEEVRLAPYIPNVADEPDVIKEKLDMFLKEYETIINEKTGTLDTQGYLPVEIETEINGGQAAAETPTTNNKGWQLMTDANGNKAYVGPNGEIEEVQ